MDASTTKTRSLLNPVYVPEKEVQELRSLFSSKKVLLKQKNQTKNRMHSIFKQNGICVTKKFLIDKTFITEMTKMEIDDIWKIQLKIFYDELASIEEAIDKIEKLAIEISIFKNFIFSLILSMFHLRL